MKWRVCSVPLPLLEPRQLRQLRGHCSMVSMMIMMMTMIIMMMMMHDDAYFVISKEVYVLILYFNHFKIQLLYSPLELFLGCIFHISNQIS